MHNFVPHLSKGYICGKCGYFCIDWDEVDRVSTTPCVDDDDPVVEKVQELIHTQIAEMWAQHREKEVIARGTVVDPGYEEEFRVFTPGEKQQFHDWLNSPDPVKAIDWEVE